MTNARGIDASQVVNWGAFPGLDFAAVKATEGDGYEDPAFKENWDRMNGVGRPRIAYHFFRAQDDPSKQAAWFTKVVRAAGMTSHDHFALDFETSDGLSDVVDVAMRAWVFVTEINRLNPGHRCLVYTMPSFAEGGWCARLGGWFLWLADWGVESPDVPPPWKRWTFWQYSRGALVDYDMFDGPVEALEEFMSHSGGA